MPKTDGRPEFHFSKGNGAATHLKPTLLHFIGILLLLHLLLAKLATGCPSGQPCGTFCPKLGQGALKRHIFKAKKVPHHILPQASGPRTPRKRTKTGGQQGPNQTTTTTGCYAPHTALRTSGPPETPRHQHSHPDTWRLPHKPKKPMPRPTHEQPSGPHHDPLQKLPTQQARVPPFAKTTHARHPHVA